MRNPCQWSSSITSCEKTMSASQRDRLQAEQCLQSCNFLLTLIYLNNNSKTVGIIIFIGPVAYLGFQKGGPNVCWPLVLTQRGPNQVFQFFHCQKNFFLAKGGYGRFGQEVNTPLIGTYELASPGSFARIYVYVNLVTLNFICFCCCNKHNLNLKEMVLDEIDM